MITKTFTTGEFLFITVPKGAKGFVVDNSMQYFIFKLLNVKEYNKVNKTVQGWQDPLNPSEFEINGGCKLPEGKFEIVGLAFRLQQSKVDEIGYSNFMKTMIEESLIAKETFILKRVN